MRIGTAALRSLPPNMQGAAWLVSGGFLFTFHSAMIRLLLAPEKPLEILTQFASISAIIDRHLRVQAFAVGEMSAVAPFDCLRLPFAVFVGWAIWTKRPVIWTYIGG